MKGWTMFTEIQHYKSLGLNKSQCSSRLKINYKTVCKYWDMSPQDYQVAYEASKTRKKKVDAYKREILEWLNEFPDLSTAQVYDWLLERYTQVDFKERTLRKYIEALRKVYKIPKHPPLRQYQEVPESPPGFQAQADFGQIQVKRIDGRLVKVYCFALVLSHSRYKFAYWQDRPFTTQDLILAHQKAFEFYGGMPKEIVYDQDRIIIVSENAGDIICTEGFQNYLNHAKFKMRLCRAYDPESKGKVEAVVKFLKYNFAKHRIFTDIEDFNEACLSWLDRTGNGKVHDIMKKAPKEVFLLEKDHLLQMPKPLINTINTSSLIYSVRKNNTISYKQNRYQLPTGTYSPGKEVLLFLKNDRLDIVDKDSEALIVSHKVCKDKGKLVRISHVERVQGSSISELYKQALFNLGETEDATYFLTRIKEEKPRYYRDQLFLINSVCKKYDFSLIKNALTYCLEHQLISATLFKETVEYFACTPTKQKDKPYVMPNLNVKPNTVYIRPEIRNIDEYIRCFQKDDKKWTH